jgi:hypothetical protein
MMPDYVTVTIRDGKFDWCHPDREMRNCCFRTPDGQAADVDMTPEQWGDDIEDGLAPLDLALALRAWQKRHHVISSDAPKLDAVIAYLESHLLEDTRARLTAEYDKAVAVVQNATEKRDEVMAQLATWNRAEKLVVRCPSHGATLGYMGQAYAPNREVPQCWECGLDAEVIPQAEVNAAAGVITDPRVGGFA